MAQKKEGTLEMLDPIEVPSRAREDADHGKRGNAPDEEEGEAFERLSRAELLRQAPNVTPLPDGESGEYACHGAVNAGFKSGGETEDGECDEVNNDQRRCERTADLFQRAPG